MPTPPWRTAATRSARGADLIDVGGESTRPGARRIPVAEELDRILPVIEGLAAGGVLVSVDTMRAEVARAAVDAGAVLINDVSGGLADPQMIELLAELHGALRRDALAGALRRHGPAGRATTTW